MTLLSSFPAWLAGRAPGDQAGLVREAIGPQEHNASA